MKETTLIQFSSKKDQSTALVDLLKKGAELVRVHEESTQLWFALQKNNSDFGIFDVFPNEKSRVMHFEGKAAAALKHYAPLLIQNGWEDGVLPYVRNHQILASRPPLNIENAKEATFIKLIPALGKSDELEKLLIQAANIIEQTEPHTLFWAALKQGDNSYAIFDIFTDKTGREEHFKGQVASLLKKQASLLIKGGWDDGVLPNIQNYKIVSSK